MEKLFIDILNMSITASYVILAVLLIRFCIRRAPKKFSYYLWAAVGFRLLCPLSFSSVISVFNLFKMDTVSISGSINYIPAGIGAIPEPKITVGIPAADRLINQSLPAAAPAAGVNPMQVMITICTVIWVTGAGVLLIYGFISYYKLIRRVSKAVHKRDNIYECDRIAAPFLWGIIKPRIYIPFRLGEEELDYIIRHERYHIKRKDYLIKPLFFILLIIYWFNPLVWLSFWSMSRDMEMSCDERVIQEMGISVKNAYSLSLLSFAANYRFPAANLLAFGETNTKGRIKNILRFKKTNWGISVIIAILCIITVIVFAANPVRQSSGEEIIPAVTAETSNSGEDTSDTVNTLTMEGVLAQKNWDGLTLDYFKAFDNALAYQFDDEAALNAYIMFELTYDGKPYELQVSYIKADSSIDSILLLKKTDSDAILLYSADPKYTIDTDVNSFLQKNITMSMYLTYKLPDGYVDGPFTATLWNGGNLFLKAGETPVGPESAPIEWYAAGGVMRLPYNKDETDPTEPRYVQFENGKLTNGSINENHSWDIGNPEILDGVEEQAVIKEVGHDLYTAAETASAEDAGNPIPQEEWTSTMWEIYFAREDGNAAYCIFLNEKYFSKEDAVAIAQSVHFTDIAFQ